MKELWRDMKEYWWLLLPIGVIAALIEYAAVYVAMHP